jgi:hypothetical protein
MVTLCASISPLAQREYADIQRMRSAKILMVIQDHERNAFDQRSIEWELMET